MSHQPREGLADDGLCGSLLRFVEDDRLPELRQALSGFNHRCRNVLNSMKMGFYLASRPAHGPVPPRLEELSRTYHEVERLFDLLQSIYRTMALTTIRRSFRSVVDERGRDWRAAFENEGGTLAIHPPPNETAGEFDPMRITAALDGFVAWRAARLGPGGRASLSWGTTRRHFELCWSEESPTVPAVRTGAPLCPVASLAATSRSLALPLLARVVAEHRGRLSWTTGPTAEARIRWPLVVTLDEASSPRRPAALSPSLR